MWARRPRYKCENRHMLLSLAVAAALTTYAPGQPWAFGMAAPPRIPLVADVDGDGFADLVAVYPPDGGIIDVALNFGAQKPYAPVQALNGWGEGCGAAVSGDFDVAPGQDIVGLFGGKSVRLAGGFAGGRFANGGVIAELPTVLTKPVMVVGANKRVLIAAEGSNRGFEVDVPGKSVKRVTWPKPLHDDVQDIKVPANTLPACPTVKRLGDFDKDGDLDVFEFRYGKESHTANEIWVYRAVTEGETDSDKDGLSNAEETQLGSNPLSNDTDGDGLPDNWEIGTFRGLDFKALGCNPRRTDVICLISRFETVKEETVKAELNRATDFYKNLPTPNPDGSTGFSFHPIYLEVVKGDDMNQAWWVNRDKFRPSKWRGVLHWMQITPGGGGQADQLGDGGSVAENAMWAVFIHEFGHQMGMDHEGFWPNNLCPIYTSLMNYAYSYGLEDDYNKIHYSDGALVGYTLKETDLDETIPLPYEKVKFLEKGPYRFRLKAAGKNTLIDWNWNGVFGEKHVRADINYSYSTNAGRRDDVGKTMTAPWLFVHEKRAYALYGTQDAPADPKTDPTVSPDKPGQLMLRRLVKPFEWEAPVTLESGGLIGDPVAASFGGRVAVVYQTKQGVMMRWMTTLQTGEISSSLPTVLNANAALVPTVAVHDKRLYVFLTDPADKSVTYKVFEDGKPVRTLILDATSTNPVGMCTDTKTGEAIIAAAQDQDGGRINRWQIRRYRSDKGKLVYQSMDWVDGEKGGSRGVGRLTVLFDGSKDAGSHGRVYLFGKGMTSKDVPWSCTYVAHTIDDKSVNGGWLVKRFYDEWTQSRSAPAAAWFNGDVIWAYRWVDGGQGASDNNFHVGYKGLGIQDEPMGDHDDLTFLRTWGIRTSLTWINPE